jgi:hypothetical protein
MHIPIVGLGKEIITLEVVPAQVGNGWRVFIEWASGRMQYISGFECLQDAEDWIKNEAQGWLRALETVGISRSVASAPRSHDRRPKRRQIVAYMPTSSVANLCSEFRQDSETASASPLRGSRSWSV